MAVLQRVVMPSIDNAAARPLYVDSPWTATPEASSPLRFGQDPLLHVDAGVEVGLGTYLNAFPASYWRAHTSVDRVRLDLRLAGSGTVSVFQSDAEGKRSGIAYLPVGPDGLVSLEIPLEDDVVDGGWLWFDLTAGPEPLTLVSGTWSSPEDPVRSGSTSIAITTHNKPEWCIASLEQLAGAPELLGLLSQIVVVDQGTDLLEDAPRFEEIAARLGGRLRVVRQGNLGGSGGFSRGMIEAVNAAGTENVLLLDDDVRLETEGIRRAITFSRFATNPVVVGGQMCDLHRPSVLHAFSEWVDPETFMWEPTPGTHRKHDFARESLVDTPWLHRRWETGFNGWWMCLIPVTSLARTGYSLPFFLKWDDAEYGLRAAEHGVATVSLPGSSLWHVAWVDKDDGIDWQSYFHTRNRLVAALLHGRAGMGSTIAALELRGLLRRSLAMQYGTSAIRLRALRDVLAGPGTLHPGIGTIVPDLQALCASFPDMRRRSPEEVPAPDATDVTMGADPMDGQPRGARFLVFLARTLVRSLLRPVRRAAAAAPEASFAHRYGEWWRTPEFDSVLVPTADNQAYFWLRRNRRLLATQLLESLRLTRRLRRRWPELAATYRAAQTDLTSEETWRRTIGLPPRSP